MPSNQHPADRTAFATSDTICLLTASIRCICSFSVLRCHRGKLSCLAAVKQFKTKRAGTAHMLRSGIIRLSFVQKLIVSFALIGVFLITAVVYAITGLNTMHRMVDDIARNDLTAATATITLRDIMLALQRATGRFQILKQPEFRDIHRRQSEVFRLTLTKLQQQPCGADMGSL